MGEKKPFCLSEGELAYKRDFSLPEKKKYGFEGAYCLVEDIRCPYCWMHKNKYLCNYKQTGEY
jgi:hypothetical protein